MTVHQVSRGTISNPITIPVPDLLDLVKTYLPGDTGIPVMYSITGGLAFRAARLAGMIANALASDIRNDTSGRTSIDSYNDAMSHLDALESAAISFEEAGSTRRNMCDDLTKLLHYKRAADDYTVTIMGESKAPVTDWHSTLDVASKPAPIDMWKLDHLWALYLDQCKGYPLMNRAEYDMLNTRELSGQDATWRNHKQAVMNIIDIADRGDSIDFYQLDLQTQLSLLNSYATPERLAKFRAAAMRRARNPFEFDASLRLHTAFVKACERATHHHRYANIGDKTIVAKREPMPIKVPALRKDNSPVGKYIDRVNESLDKEAELDAKASKRKPAKPRGKIVAQEHLAEVMTTIADTPNDL
jgi:hypothetical protein